MEHHRPNTCTPSGHENQLRRRRNKKTVVRTMTKMAINVIQMVTWEDLVNYYVTYDFFMDI